MLKAFRKKSVDMLKGAMIMCTIKKNDAKEILVHCIGHL